MSGTYLEPDGLQTAGHAGGATSEERARREAQDGTLSGRLFGVREIAWSMRETGVTVAEVRHTLHLHHGQASGALTNLHRTGHLARLSQRRNACFIYVAPEFVNGRETQRPGHVRGSGATVERIVEVRPLLSTEEGALVQRLRREYGGLVGDPSALTMIEAGDVLRLLDIIEARS